MKHDREYLVSDGLSSFFFCSPEAIERNNDKGAGFRLAKVDDKGRIYLEKEEPLDAVLFNEEL